MSKFKLVFRCDLDVIVMYITARAACLKHEINEEKDESWALIVDGGEISIPSGYGERPELMLES